MNCAVVQSSLNDEWSCSVCYEITTDALDCNHSLCHVCKDKWFRISPSCPICRRYYGEPNNTKYHDDVSHFWIHLFEPISPLYQNTEIVRSSIVLLNPDVSHRRHRYRFLQHL